MKIAQFLALYNALDTRLKQLPDAPQTNAFRWYEEAQGDCELRNKLFTCRIMRNYLVHNNDTSFLQITDAQLRFLQECIDNVTKDLETVDALMCPKRKLVCCTMTHRVVDAVAAMGKKKEMAVYLVDAKGVLIGRFTVQTLVQHFATLKKTTTFADIAKDCTLPPVFSCLPNTPITELEETRLATMQETGNNEILTVIVDKKGKLLGIYDK